MNETRRKPTTGTQCPTLMPQLPQLYGVGKVNNDIHIRPLDPQRQVIVFVEHVYKHQWVTHTVIYPCDAWSAPGKHTHLKHRLRLRILQILNSVFLAEVWDREAIVIIPDSASPFGIKMNELRKTQIEIFEIFQSDPEGVFIYLAVGEQLDRSSHHCLFSVARSIFCVGWKITKIFRKSDILLVFKTVPLL